MNQEIEIEHQEVSDLLNRLIIGRNITSTSALRGCYVSTPGRRITTVRTYDHKIVFFVTPFHLQSVPVK
jgi:hypothetical protein